MFNLFNLEEENKFTWNSVGDIVQGRENLGEDMPVFVHRLFQFAIKSQLTQIYGNEAAIDVFRKAGHIAGIEFANNMLNLNLNFSQFIAQLQKVLEQRKMGILRIEEFDYDTGKATLTISEDLECSGLPVTGKTVCNYDEGFLAGILNAYTKKDYIVTEVDCWATGSRVCRFEAHIKE